MCGVESLVGVVGRVYVGVGAWVRRIEYDVCVDVTLWISHGTGTIRR